MASGGNVTNRRSAMYELMDVRKHGQDAERPILIVDHWHGKRRLVMQFRACDEAYAGEILESMNEFVYGVGNAA